MTNSVEAPIEPEAQTDLDARQTEVIGNADLQELETVEQQPTCGKCGTFESWGTGTWCPVCGYYPKFDEAPEEIDRSLQGTEEVVCENWWEVIPRWAWILIGGAVAILVGSIAVRVYYHFYGGRRGYWATRQLFLGCAITIAAHCRAAFIGLNKDHKLTPSDVFIAPIATWNRSIKMLPKSRIQIWMAGWGIMLMVTAMVIIGGIRYSAVFDDWGFKSEKPDLMPDQIARGIGGGRGKQGLSKLEQMPVVMPNAPEGPFVECVVYGYFPDPEGKRIFDTVLFAGSTEREPVHIASLEFAEIPKKHQRQVSVLLRERRVDEPFVDSSYDAIWVEPSIVCKINYSSLTPGGRLQDAEFAKVAVDLRKDVGFKRMMKKGNYSALIGRLDVETYDRKYEQRVEKYEAECARILKKHQERIAKLKKLTDGNKTQETFDEVSEALNER